MAALPKIKRKRKSAEYVNTQFGAKTTITKAEETQDNYEEVSISTINIIQDNKERIKASQNEYLDWDDRKHDAPTAHNDLTHESLHSQNCTLQVLELPKQKHVANTTKWKIITLISVMFCVGLTSGLIAVVVVKLSERVSPCSESKCLNNGTCLVVADEAVCICVNGFFGTHCETTPCSNSSCQNEGTCYIHQLQSRCACENGFLGNNCEISLCSSGPCVNGGTCSMTIANDLPQLQCTCPAGFHGLRCEATPCSSYPCLNGGICSVVGNEYNCTCPLPISGRRCEETPCSNSSCQNEGTCFFHQLQSRCACNNGFMGDNCEVTPCSSNPCMNGGYCSIVGSEFNCTCLRPYTGRNCEVTPCSSNPCANGGNCSINGNTYRCTCPTARSGTRCEASIAVFKTIQSPGFPEDYTNNLNLAWNVDVGSGNIAVLSFITFNTESGYDFVYVCNGYSTCNQELFKGSGTSLPAEVKAIGQYMFIQFKTDGSAVRTGFLAFVYRT